MVDPVLLARDVRVRFAMERGDINAVRGIDLDIFPREIVALVGESGSGKSAFAKSVLRLHAPPFVPARAIIDGSIRLHRDGEAVELVGASERTMRSVRAKDIAMVSQDALSGLNPVMRVEDQLCEAMEVAGSAQTRDESVASVLRGVGLADVARVRRSFSHQLSGGQRQRVLIALAVARRPRLIIADEPTTALDVTVQAQILRLLEDLRTTAGTSILFITHDLDVVAAIADRAAVLYAGEVVEIGATERIFRAPRHPYTKGLLASRPGTQDRAGRLVGTPIDPSNLPQGCAFRPRCAVAVEACRMPPPAIEVADGFARCFRSAA